MPRPISSSSSAPSPIGADFAPAAPPPRHGHRERGHGDRGGRGSATEELSKRVGRLLKHRVEEKCLERTFDGWGFRGSEVARAAKCRIDNLEVMIDESFKKGETRWEKRYDEHGNLELRYNDESSRRSSGGEPPPWATAATSGASSSASTGAACSGGASAGAAGAGCAGGAGASCAPGAAPGAPGAAPGTPGADAPGYGKDRLRGMTKEQLLETVPEECLDDPWMELRWFKEKEWWPFCLCCRAWSDSCHIVSKRHRNRLENWGPPPNPPPAAASYSPAADEDEDADGFVCVNTSSSDAETAASNTPPLAVKASPTKHTLRLPLGDRVACYQDRCLLLIPRDLYRKEKFSMEEVDAKSQPKLPKGYRPAGKCLRLGPELKEDFPDTVWVVIPACSYATKILRSKPDGSWEELENVMFASGYAIVGVRHFCDLFPVSEGLTLRFVPYLSRRRGTTDTLVQVLVTHILQQACHWCEERLDEKELQMRNDPDFEFVKGNDVPPQLDCHPGDQICMRTRNESLDPEYVVDVLKLPDWTDTLEVHLEPQDGQRDFLKIKKVGDDTEKTIKFRSERFPEESASEPPEPPAPEEHVTRIALELDGATGAQTRLRLTCNGADLTRHQIPTLYDFCLVHCLDRGFQFDRGERHHEVVGSKAAEDLVDMEAIRRELVKLVAEAVKELFGSPRALGTLNVYKSETFHPRPGESLGRTLSARTTNSFGD